MSVSTRSATATGPIHTSHIQIDIIGNFDIWIVFLNPIISPEVTASLSTFFSRPQAEHHGVASAVPSHRFCNSQHHTGSSSVVIGSYSGAIGSSENVRVEHASIDWRCDVEVSTKHHPFVRVYLTKSVSADVVCLRVLCPSLERIVGETLRDDFESETSQGLDEVLSRIFVSSIALACPAI